MPHYAHTLLTCCTAANWTAGCTAAESGAGCTAGKSGAGCTDGKSGAVGSDAMGHACGKWYMHMSHVRTVTQVRTVLAHVLSV